MSELVPKLEELGERIQVLMEENEQLQLDKCKLLREVEDLKNRPSSSRPLPEMTGTAEGLKLDAAAVQQAFRRFLKVYYLFKKAHGLPHTYDDARDMALAFAGKAGRVVDLIKHEQRGDPKDLHELNLEKQLFGALAYITVIGDRYNLAFDDGVIKELISGVQQHGGKEDVDVQG